MANPGEVVSAATLVASVLEHQGYITQQRFLDSFQSLFRDAGAIFYLIAGASAIFSMLAHGSYRSARYLIIGPAIFWALVVPRAENFSGSLWKLGNGQFRGIKGVPGQQAALADREKILQKLNQQGQGPNSKVRVAQGFYLFAKPASDFANEMVGVFLKDEDRSDLLVASRAHALLEIASAVPKDTDFIQRFEQGFLNHCGNTMSAALAAAQVLVKNNAAGAFRPQGNAPNNTYQQLLTNHLNKVTYFAKNGGGAVELVPTRGTGFDELIRAHSDAGTNAQVSIAAQLVDELGEPFEHIRCAEAWSLIAEEIWARASLEEERALGLATNELKNPAARTAACERLTEKAVFEPGAGQAGAGCDLRAAISLAMLNRRFNQNDLYNRVLKRHWNDSPHRNPRREATLSSGALADQGFRAVIEGGRQVVRRATNALGSMFTQSLMYNDTGEGRKFVWSAVMSISMDYGMDDAMWVTTRQFEIINLRRQIYTYGLHVPYYQGIILFLIAAGYPFFALLVVVPGKAMSFLTVPLAWLWAKSWDIGFAAAIIVDKVLFNLLPSQNIVEPLRSGPWRDIELLPRALAEATNYDPLGALHSYYAVLALIWLNVPLISGYIFLQARRGVLSAFSDAAAQGARTAGGEAATGWGIGEQDKGFSAMREIMKFAGELPTLSERSSGATGNLGLQTGVARVLAGQTVAAQVPKGVDTEKLLKGDLKHVGALSGDVAKAYNDKFYPTLQAEAKLSSQLYRVYDTMIGRYAVINQLMGAKIASGEGGTGYEFYEKMENITDAVLAVKQNRFETALDIYAANAQAIVKQSSAGVTGKGAGFPEVMVGAAVYQLTQQFGGDAAISKLKPQGFDDAQFRFALEAYPVPRDKGETPQSVWTREEQINATQNSFSAFFGVYNDTPPPGGFGAREYIDKLLGTLGGERIVQKFAPGEERPAPGIPPGQDTRWLNPLPPVSSGVWNVEESKILEKAAAFDTEQRKLFPTDYSRSVDNLSDSLSKIYGDNIYQHYKIDKNEKLSVQQIYDYTLSLQKTEEETTFKNTPVQGRPQPLDPRLGERTKTNEKLVLERLIGWNESRGRRDTRPQTGYLRVPDGEKDYSSQHLWHDGPAKLNWRH